jgi:hypothetical protein
MWKKIFIGINLKEKNGESINKNKA